MKRFPSAEAYAKYFQVFIEEERKAQKAFHWNEIQQLTPEERQRRGRALLYLRFKSLGTTTGGYHLYRFYTQNVLPKHQFQTGDWVLVTQKERPTLKDPKGVVYELYRNAIVIAFPDEPPPFQKKKPVRIDLYLNEITFLRMQDALKQLKQCTLPWMPYLLGIPSEYPYRKGAYAVTTEHFASLNSYQKKALLYHLENQAFVFGLLHGPPGTGKTTTLSVFISEQVAKGKRVLAAADSNIAVDNLLEKLLERGIHAIRIGNPFKIHPRLKAHTLEARLVQHPHYPAIKRLYERVERLRRQQQDYLAPIPSRRRGLPAQAILTLAKQQQNARGIPVKTMKSMAQWLTLQEQIRQCYEEIHQKEKELITKILNEASVVCATLSACALLEDITFDIGVIDEATQATEPATLIALLRARQVLLAGDDKQLPPTIIAEKLQKTYRFSLFERWHKLYPSSAKLLRMQYRMHPLIMQFVSETFYNGRLIGHESVERPFPFAVHTGPPWFLKTMQKDLPMVWIATPKQAKEEKGKGAFSYFNRWEVRTIVALIHYLWKNQVPMGAIGIIAPYEAQATLLSKNLLYKDLEIKTVDGFQGREKEMIILSFVRNNPQKQLGFLTDYRRLNVAISRAKTKLVIVGNIETLTHDPYYARLYRYVKQNGAIIKLP